MRITSSDYCGYYCGTEIGSLIQLLSDAVRLTHLWTHFQTKRLEIIIGHRKLFPRKPDSVNNYRISEEGSHYRGVVDLWLASTFNSIYTVDKELSDRQFRNNKVWAEVWSQLLMICFGNLNTQQDQHFLNGLSIKKKYSYFSLLKLQTVTVIFCSNRNIIIKVLKFPSDCNQQNNIKFYIAKVCQSFLHLQLSKCLWLVPCHLGRRNNKRESRPWRGKDFTKCLWKYFCWLNKSFVHQAVWTLLGWEFLYVIWYFIIYNRFQPSIFIL